jgi:hypothetical protein
MGAVDCRMGGVYPWDILNSTPTGVVTEWEGEMETDMFARMAVYLRNYAFPVRRFHRLAIRRQDAKSKMDQLNTRRRQIQRQIVELYGNVDVCKTCRGYCCRGNYNHFTVFDYLIRMHSDNPIHDYGTDLGTMWPVYRIVWRRIAGFLRGIDEYDQKRLAHQSEGTRCPDSTDSGCRLPPEDRPIRCVVWTCSALRKQLNDDDFARIGRLIGELCSMSDEAIRVFGY